MLTSGTKTIEASEAPEVDFTDIFTMPSGELVAVLKASLLSASSDATRLALCGVHIVGHFKTFESTDGHRATRIERKDAQGHRGFIFPADELAKVLKALPKSEKAACGVNLKIDAPKRSARGVLTVSWGSTEVVITAIDCDFPMLDRVIPRLEKRGEETPDKVRVNAHYLADVGAIFGAFAKCCGIHAPSIDLSMPIAEGAPMRADMEFLGSENKFKVCHVVMPTR